MTESTVEWSVNVELGLDGSQASGKVAHAAEDLVDLLADGAPAVAVGEASVGVQLSVRSRSAVSAVKTAVIRVERAAAQAGLCHRGVETVEAATVERLEAALTEPSLPGLVGTSEVAALLGVSRQRVSELSRAGHFPTPLATLASGPVWMKAAIARFAESWDRSPGRRPTAEPARTPAAERIVPRSVARVAPPKK
jgi:predicted DNA-binding transcriptional regulator AlpA